jgi:hypothetical protein
LPQMLTTWQLYFSFYSSSLPFNPANQAQTVRAKHSLIEYPHTQHQKSVRQNRPPTNRAEETTPCEFQNKRLRTLVARATALLLRLLRSGAAEPMSCPNLLVRLGF